MNNHVIFEPWRRCYWITDHVAVHPNTVLRIYATNTVDLFIDRMMGVET